ncbi:hypothetical protein OJ996_03990 [Luteolibacter sp. GHJ8]|uniref:Uncharacterized protein n=1 Tax=Luteolibacter rhizosphaerae TaxID=2989719 RepID=A0ABT3FYR3_9BACT|nr:hypothetical protein [Luteolibacter rhizosphaerae]MCW1912720.1 hypothetical protein [Luteolibacter rhizosphaerae]
MRWTLTFLLPCLLATASAKEQPLAACPDKAIEAVYRISNDGGEAEEIIFKVKSTGKKIASFPSGGFGTEVPELLWSSDGRLAAVSIRTTRNTRNLMVFHVTADEAKQVQLQDFTQNIYGRLGILRGTGSSSNKPLRWLAADRLLISAWGALENEDWYDYEVELTVIQDAGNRVGWLEKITDVKKEKEE